MSHTAADAHPSMELSFVGTGSAFNPLLENTNAFFVVGEELYLIDCGESAFARHFRLPYLKAAKRITVVITHLHCDHVGSLGSLISYCYYVLGTPIRIVHPLETIVGLLDLMGIKRRCYQYQKELRQNPGESVDFRPVEVEHVDDMTCFGYIISTARGSVYISGDAKSVPSQVLSEFFAGKIDRIYQDTSLETSDHPTHGTLAWMEATFPPDVRQRVTCVHLDTDYRSLLIQKGFSPVSLAGD